MQQLSWFATKIAEIKITYQQARTNNKAGSSDRAESQVSGVSGVTHGLINLEVV